MKKTVVVLLADGFEEIEALTPVDYLRRAGCFVVIAAVKDDELVEGVHGIKVVADIKLADFVKNESYKDFDCIVIPGGMPGASNIAQSEQAVNLIKAFVEKGKLIGCICASPAVVLPKTGALEGHKWTCYPSMEESTGPYKANHIKDQPFVHDGNLVTGRGPGAAEEFSMELVKTLTGQESYVKVKTASLQR